MFCKFSKTITNGAYINIKMGTFFIFYQCCVFQQIFILHYVNGEKNLYIAILLCHFLSINSNFLFMHYLFSIAFKSQRRRKSKVSKYPIKCSSVFRCIIDIRIKRRWQYKYMLIRSNKNI